MDEPPNGGVPVSRTLTIDPVTRIEGHAKVDIEIDDNDNVVSARLVVRELRGFERILQPEF